MRIEWREEKRKIKDLKDYDKNPRRISKDVFEKLVDSIKQDGYHGRIMVYGDIILGGHQRKKALLKAGYKNSDEIAVIVPNRELSDDEFNRLNIRDNLPYGEFDFDILANDFDADKLIEWGMPEEWLLGKEFEDIEVEDSDDESPDPPADPSAKLGDVYILGDHRVMCGDATSITSVEKLMNGNIADMVFTDPPYNTGMKPKSGSTRLSHMFNDSFTDEQWDELLSGFIANAWAFMKEDSVAYICLDWRRNHEIVKHIDTVFKRSNLIVWDKVVHGLGSDYKYTHEFINVCKKGKPKLTTNQNEDKEYSDVWHIQRKTGKDEEHATKKPIELILRPIRHASKKNDLVLDLFGGSGSTLVACEKSGRRCYMMELSPSYVDVIVARWEKLTGEKAVLEKV
jgi:DNA modification methylase